MSEKKTAAEIIVKVMEDVQSLAKKDKNTQQGFNFRGIDAVMNVVGPALRKHGGFIMPLVDKIQYDTAASRNGGTLNIARVTVSYAVYGQNGPDDVIMGSAFAEAFDSGDKATAKAMSVAYRTFLLQLLCLPTDERDPDEDSYEMAATAKPAAAVPEDFDKVLLSCYTVEALQDLWNEALKEGYSEQVKATVNKRKLAIQKGQV